MGRDDLHTLQQEIPMASLGEKKQKQRALVSAPLITPAATDQTSTGGLGEAEVGEEVMYATIQARGSLHISALPDPPPPTRLVVIPLDSPTDGTGSQK